MNLEPSHFIILTLIGGWVIVMLTGARHAHEKERMKHLERLAMIEKGLVPPVEPSTPESVLHTMTGAKSQDDSAERERKALESVRFIGVLAIGGGVAVWFMLTVLDEWKDAVAI